MEDIFFCEFNQCQAMKVWQEGDEGKYEFGERTGLRICAVYLNGHCAHRCIIAKESVLPKVPLAERLVLGEIEELKSRLAMRNRQIRDLRRELRKKS